MTYKPRIADVSPSAKPPPLKHKRAWVVWMAVPGVILCLLFFAEFLIWSSLRQGWTSYKNNVTALAVDQQGRVWAAVTNGSSGSLVLYSNDEAPVQITLPDELAGVSVQSMAIDRQNRVWVGTMTGLIGSRDINGQWALYSPENPQNQTPFPVSDLVIDGQDRAWARYATKLVRIDPAAGSNIYTSASAGLADNRVCGIAVDDQGQLWAINTSGLMVLGQNNDWTTYAFASDAGINLPIDCVLAIDHESRLWLGTVSGVMALGLDGTLQPYALGDPAAANQIKELVVDNQGRVWAVGDQGLFGFDPATGWASYDQRNSGLAANTTTALALDGQGRLWIGTLQDGLSRFDPALALPEQQRQTLVNLGRVVIPAVLLSMALVAILAFAFTRPGAISGRTIFDFSLAFVCWFIFNSIMWIFIKSTAPAYYYLNPWVVVPLPVNVVVLALMLLLKKRWLALGAFSAFIVNGIGAILVSAVVLPGNPSPVSGLICMLPFYLPFFMAVTPSNYGHRKFPD